MTVVVLVAAAIRVSAATGELWLDEIWSVRLAHLAQGPAGVFTNIHIDNNHHLNTLYLQRLPESGAAWIWYRVHVLAAGVGIILLSARIAFARGAHAAVAAAILTGGSFLLTLYSSEARGYALAVFFALAAVPLAQRHRNGNVLWAIAFGIVCALGVISHITFLHAYFGLLVWTAVTLARSTTTARWAIGMMALHLIPLATAAALYWLDLRHIVEGGGPLTSPLEVAARALSLAAGGPESGEFRGLAAIAALAVAVFSISAVRRSGSDLWILFAAGGLGAPAATLLLIDSSLLFERYFLVALSLLLVSVAWTIARAAERALVVALALLLAYGAANGVHIARLVRDGRGHYVAALEYMRANSRSTPVIIGSDHDFRHGRVLEYYAPSMEGAYAYVTRQQWPPSGPEWVLIHDQTIDFVPRAQISVQGGLPYMLRQTYGFGGLSGWHLAIYQKP